MVVIIAAPSGLASPSSGAPSPAAAPLLYAMGDSYASGYGNPTETDASCSRSAEGYPYVASDALGMELQDRACAGATVSRGILGSQLRNVRIMARQLGGMKASRVPAVVTMSIGGDDLGVYPWLAQCVEKECGTAADDEKLQGQLASVEKSIRKVYTTASTLFENTAKPVFLAVGYPTPLPTELPADCLSTEGLTQDELDWFQLVMVSLNEVVRDAAAGFDFAHYVPAVSTVGHDACSDDPWFFEAGTSGNLHPTSLGHDEMGASVVDAYRSLTTEAPAPPAAV